MSEYLYTDGARYDQMYAGSSHDLTFWLRQAIRYGEPVLELACGTGRVAIPLALGGYEVTGIDLSDEMLSRARERAAEAHAAVEWVRGDIRDFDLGRTFALVIFPLNTICHLLTLEDLERCLAAVRRHLAAGGRFVIDVFVPDIRSILTRDPEDRYPFAQYVATDGATVQVYSTTRYEPDTQISRVTLYERQGEGPEVRVGELNMRMYFPQELDALLKYNGFAIERKHGAYDLSPFGPASGKQLLVCRAG